MKQELPGFFHGGFTKRGKGIAMKLLGVSAGNKNGTNDAMVREALMGAKEAGAEVEFVRLLDLNLKPCIGCCLCVTGKDGVTRGGSGRCIVKDDFEWFEDKFLEADGILFSLPIFEKGVPGVFKMIQDRLGGPSHDLGMLTVSAKIREEKIAGGEPVSERGPDPRALKPKVLGGIAIGGSDWVCRAEGDFKLFAMAGAHTVVDTLVFPWAKSILVEDDRIAQIRELGRRVAEAARNPETAGYSGEPGMCPHCHTRLMYIRDNAKECECSVCGIIGEIQVRDGRVSFVFPEEQLEHAHTSMAGKMSHMRDIGENEGKFARIKMGDEYKRRIAAYDDFIKATKPGT